MVSSFLVCCVMLVGGDAPGAADPVPKPDLGAYEVARAKAGKSADAHIRLALWCEARGLTAERIKHLSLAVLYDPGNALARGLLGLVSYQGKWERPEEVGRAVQNDPIRKARINDYLQRRVRTPIAPRTSGNWPSGASRTI